MNELRTIDRIDTAPRFAQADVDRLNERFAAADTRTMLRGVIGSDLIGRAATVSSFGAESIVLLHLLAQADPGLPVLFLETGKHFPETLAYRDEVAQALGLTNLINLTPDANTLAAKDENGLRWSYDPDGCCDIRKVQPLAQALADFDASFTGRKAFQNSARAALPRFELDTSDAAGRLKINPLIDWSQDDIDGYFETHDLPRHPLIERGFPSIGCSPCTRQVGEGEDARAGRWSGWDKVECGIHKPGEEPFPGDLPPGYDPAF